MTELISVIIPVHNAALYLNKIFMEISSQTYRNLEMIPVDDGSEDESAEIIKEWQKKDERIRPIFQESSGVSEARNAGLLASHGAYIIFLDADDEIEPDIIYSLYEAHVLFEKKYGLRAGLSICGYEEIFASGKIVTHLPGKDSYAGRGMMEALFDDSGFFSAVWNKLFRRDILYDSNGKLILFETGVHIAEDTLYLTRILKNAMYAAVNKKILYHWKRHAESATHGIRCGSQVCLTRRDITVLKAYRLIVYELSDYDRTLSQNAKRIYLGLLRDFLVEAEKEKKDRLRAHLEYLACKEFQNFQVKNIRDWTFAVKYKLCLWMIRNRMSPVLIECISRKGR